MAMAPSKLLRWCCAAFLFGVASISFLAPSIDAFVWWIGTCLLGALSVCFYRMSFRAFLFLLLVTCIFFGAFRTQGVLARDGLLWAVDFFHGDEQLEMTGVIIETPVQKGLFSHLVVRPERMRDRVLEQTGILRVSAQTTLSFKQHDRITFSGSCAPLEKTRLPSHILERLRAKHIQAFCFAESVHRIGTAKIGILQSLVTHILSFSTSAMYAHLHEPEASLLSGMLLGARQTFDSDLFELFTRTGVLHIIAVSGYNIALVSGFLFLCMKYLPTRRTTRCVIVLFGILFFTLLTGAHSATVRAAVMAVCVVAAVLRGRLTSAFHILLVAASIMVLFEPTLLLFDLGFQLSVAATAGLIGGVSLLEKRLPLLSRLPVVGDGVMQSLATFIATAPLLVATFQSLSLSSLLANSVIILIVPLIMIGGFAWLCLVGLVGVFLPASHLVFQLMTWPIWFLLHSLIAIVEAVSYIPFGFVHIPPIPFPEVVVSCMYIGLGFIMWMIHRRERTQHV